jgi:dolichol-phosphate mannosyltransferase
MISNKGKQFVSLVVYIYNDENNIKPFWASVVQAFVDNFEKIEIICVNDKSDDASTEVIRSTVKALPQNNIVSILNISSHQGVETAMNAGVDLAIGDLIFEFDSIVGDITEGLIVEAYQKAVGGYDIVTVTPQKTYDFLSSVFYKILNWGMNEKANPITREGFRIVSRRALNRIESLNLYVPYRKAVYAKCGLPSARLSYVNNRRVKKEKMSNRVNLAVESLILFTDVIQKLSLFICLSFASFAVIVAIYTVAAYFGVNKPIPGWAPTMGFLSVGFFGMFFLFTIVFKYLSVLLNTVFIKQRYIVESIEKI